MRIRERPILKNEDVKKFLEKEKQVNEKIKCFIEKIQKSKLKQEVPLQHQIMLKNLCENFGNPIAKMNNCVKCFYENKELWIKCIQFKNQKVKECKNK